jgi:hypothetical protein
VKNEARPPWRYNAMLETIMNLLSWAFLIAVVIAVFAVARRDGKINREQSDILHRGVEVEAEILARFEAGALQGSDVAVLRQRVIATWDPLELELRYAFGGREIVSRGRVSAETFFRTRSQKTLRIKVSPERPDRWVALAEAAPVNSGRA